jgi:hypothetical protein
MRVVGALLAVVLGMGALAGTIWAVRYAPWVPEQEHHLPLVDPRSTSMRKDLKEAPPPPPLHTEDKDLKKRPEIVSKEPFPKAVTGERVHEFGTMGLNEEQKHKFKISNEGKGQLDLEVGPSSCKCTVGNLPKKRVMPGETVDVELIWKGKEVTNNFAQYATIWTSDPSSPEIQFKVYGKVAEKYVVAPAVNWHVGHITDVQDGATTGQILSSVDQFKVNSVDVNNPHVKVTYAPIDSMTLVSLHAKSGYDFNVKADRGLAMGTFRIPLRIHTTIDGGKTIEVDVTGTRSGPILYLPPQGHAQWYAEKARLSLGRIHRGVGSKVKLPAIVYGMNDKLRIEKVTSDAPYLKVSLETNPEVSQGQQQGVFFVFEVPPGSPPETRVPPNGVPVTLETNHPKLKTLTFEVDYICQ